MLITISGMVGSGKSTTARRIVELLEASGLSPQYLRFRSLNLFGTTEESRHFSGSESPPPPAGVRGTNFKPRRLTLFYAVGYAARILAFRLSRVGKSSRCVIYDRYFYDNFIHYRLTSRLERVYLAIVRSLIPTPDIAFLLIAADDAISRRRPEYAFDYVVTVCRRYHQLPDLFPGLICIRTDAPDLTREHVAQVLRRVLHGNAGRA